MHEVKRYDAHGNLIEVISADKCRENYWKNFGKINELTPEQIANNNQAHGMFHLVTAVQRSDIKKQCAYCGDLFQPPRHKPRAKYCFKPGVPESQQCRRFAYREKLLGPTKNITCVMCGTVFESRKKNARYCPSPNCNSNAHKVQQNANGRIAKCAFCEAPFKASHYGNQKYCIMPYFVNQLQCRTLALKARKRAKLSQ